MSSPIDPGSRGTSTFHIDEENRSGSKARGKSRHGRRVQAVDVTNTEGLKPRFLSNAPIRTKLGSRIGISFAKPFVKLSAKLRGGKLPDNFHNDLKAAIDGSDGRLFRHTMAKIDPFSRNKLYQESLSGKVTLHEPPNLVTDKRDDQIHQQWMDCRIEGKPPLFYLAKRGNYSMVERACRNPGVGVSSVEEKSVPGNGTRVIGGDLNKKGLAGYDGSPFCFALDNGNLDTALAMAANGGTLQYGGAVKVFGELELTPEECSEFHDAFMARKMDIKGELTKLTDWKEKLNQEMGDLKKAYPQLVSWDNPNFMSDQEDVALSEQQWGEIKEHFMSLRSEEYDLRKPIRLLRAQNEHVSKDLAIVSRRLIG